jgi:nifR3 family TIM-barrel protein
MKLPSQLIKENPFILAPMDDVTDIAFRELAEECGVSYSTSELTSIDAIVRDKVKHDRYARGNLKYSSVQLFGSKPQVFVDAANKVLNDADAIDVNFGCPSACVNANDAGAMLLKDPKNVGEIIAKLVKHIDRPITAKIRLGYKKTTYNEVAKEIEDAGADVLAVHGRTAEQKYSGLANWDSIKEIYESTNITLIGNGDIREPTQIDDYLQTHCDALMIGRAAIGNPMIFDDFNQYYKNEQAIELSNDEKKERQKELFLRYLEKLSHYDIAKQHQRIWRQAMWFFKGLDGAKKLRVAIVDAKDDLELVIKLVKEF